MKISRNAPCPCGSGKKNKKCCGTEEILKSKSAAENQEHFITESIPEYLDLPEFSLEYYQALEVEKITAQKLLYVCLRSPKLESIALEASNSIITRGRLEAERIKNCRSTSDLVDMMKNGIDALNIDLLQSRLLERPEEATAVIIDELRKSVDTAFVELSARIITRANVDVSGQVMAIIEKQDKPVYQLSVLCLVLGFFDNPKSIPFLWKYFSYFRAAFKNQTYWLAPFYALWDTWARKEDEKKGMKSESNNQKMRKYK